MSKVRITTVSGIVLEKPIITCFKSNIGTYLVLDNEKNGTMGLPIILVCRLYQGKLSKIIDQGEWQSVKEELKSIIAKQNAQYESIPTDLTADDVYYTQLTLPVNSFEILKNSYVAPDNTEPTIAQSNIEQNIPEVPVEPTLLAQVEQPAVAPVEPVEEAKPVQQITESTIMPEEPSAQQMPSLTPEVSAPVMPSVETTELPQIEVPQPVMQTPIAPEITPDISQVSPIPVAPVTPVAPTVEIPSNSEISMPSNTTISQPTSIMPEVPVQQSVPETPEIPTPVIPQTQVMPPTSEVPQTSGQIASEDIEEIKRTFMQACENMFDALIIKFQK